MAITEQDIRNMSHILEEKYGTAKAIEYCSKKVKQYELLMEQLPKTIDGINDAYQHKVMRDYFLAVAALLQK
jgi:hypothetical protein